MRSLSVSLLLAVLVIPAIPASGAPCITDDAGDRLCMERPARRVIPLYAAFTDILMGMGQANRIVGRTRADAPNGLSPDISVIGTHMRPSMELVLGLKPDLALQMGGRAEAAESVAALRQQGIPTAFFQVRPFEDLVSVIERVGILTGSETEATRLAASLRSRLELLRQTVTGLREPIPSVFFEVRYPNLLGAGPDSIVTDIIRFAGGQNVLAGSNTTRKGRVARLSEEELLRLDPDVYILQFGPMNKIPVPLRERPHFSGLRAVKSGRTLHVDEHLFSRPGPRAVDAAESLARFLHPNLFSPSQETTTP